MTETELLKEEIFCLNYELKIFAGFVNYGRLERWVKNYTDKVTEHSHIQRYDLASGFVNDKMVLDIACGSGHGSYLLADQGKAKEITAIDLDAETIRYASFRNQHPNINFLQGDAMKFCRENYFDVIVSFETIEHLSDANSFLENINRSLKKDGIFIVSTPISGKALDSSPSNVYHIQEWGFKNFHHLVAEHLAIDKVFLQLYPWLDDSLAGRVKRKLSNKTMNCHSEIFEYTADRDAEFPSLGKNRKGYQIVFCKKKI
jgi:2-polyprenyl-3-methyl-5-hydroxy-6-metoxy-1,4-benzoquinol methylase